MALNVKRLLPSLEMSEEITLLSRPQNWKQSWSSKIFICNTWNISERALKSNMYSYNMIWLEGAPETMFHFVGIAPWSKWCSWPSLPTNLIYHVLVCCLDHKTSCTTLLNEIIRKRAFVAAWKKYDLFIHNQCGFCAVGA